jgi:hypothetical protein
MENIKMQSEELAILSTLSINLPPKKRPISAEQIYSTLVKYPVTKEVCRYPKQTDKTIQPAFHLLLQTNLDLLVPNIDIGYQMDMEHNQMFDWIITAKEYVNKLNEDFQQRCDRRTQKIIAVEQRNQRSKTFNMQSMDKLPEDIIRYIHNFLLPETRIQLLRARYPNLDANVMKLKVPMLKVLLRNIETKIYTPMMNSLYKNNRHRCLPAGFYITFGYNHKNDCMNKINKFIGTCETAVAHSPSDYRYFQNKALKILKKLVYVAKTKRVLDEPYAPELEIPKPIKKPRKPRAKKEET